MGDFPKAVQKAIGTGVPCARPYTGIELLKLINDDHVKNKVFKKHVLRNPGNSAETLIAYVDDDGQKQALTNLVATAGVNHVQPLDVKHWTSLMAGVQASISLEAQDLANVGLKATSDAGWSLSFRNGRITKKSVNMIHLRRFLKANRVSWGDELKYTKAVVTAVYAVTGGLIFTGRTELVTTGGVRVPPPPNVPITITAGWQYTVINTGTIVLSEINPEEWIIAIEYTKVGPDKDGKVTLKGQTVTARIADDEATDP